MTLERRRAATKGYESPIWDTLQQTHDNYNRCEAPGAHGGGGWQAQL